MDVRTDDELYRVDRRYLGPKGKPLPVQAPYRQWGMALLIFVLLLMLLRALTLPLGPAQGCLMIAAAWLSASWIEKHLTPDRPIVEEMRRIGQEIMAPRPKLREAPETHRLALEVPIWPAGALPNRRWYARAWHAIANATTRGWRVITRRDAGVVYEEGEWTDV